MASDFAQQVKGSVDIVRVIGDYVRLKKAGPERFAGLCPFHSEKSPSFSVHARLQIFKCFGCGKGGDVFSFLMEYSGLSFVEALHQLAEQHGIPIPKRREGAEADADAKHREALYRAHELAQQFFERQLFEAAGEEALAYLRRRGLGDATIRAFGIGHAPAGNRLLSLLERQGFGEEALVGSGLVGKPEDRPGYYDRFRDRVTFPIANQTGKIIGFGARALRDEQQPKYLNSPETAIYKKSAVLYNLHRAREPMHQKNRVILAEGYMDVIGVAGAGVGEVVASCGTALTQQQVRTLRRLVDTVVVNFDSDSAGQSAVEKSLQLLLEENFHVKVLELPGGLDPDEYCRQHGADAYRRQLDHARNFSVWLADRARTKFDLSTAEGRVDAFEFLKPSIHLLPDKIQRAAVANDIAERLGVNPGLILEEFRRSSADRGRRAAPPSIKHPLGHSERLLLELFLDSPEARAEMLPQTAEATRAQQSAGAAIFQAMLAAQESGEPFEFSAIEGRLQPRDREILSQIVFDRDRQPFAIEQGRSALAAIERQGWEREYRAVRREIVEAERNSDRRESLRLLQRKVELERRLGVLRPQA
ncbi:MAG: DNA primase [Acidobacteria bacterium]|nr:DNA primase [Acidobacteriota bacterium]